MTAAGLHARRREARQRGSDYLRLSLHGGEMEDGGSTFDQWRAGPAQRVIWDNRQPDSSDTSLPAA